MKSEGMQPPLSLGYLASYLRKYDEDKHNLNVIDENTGENVEKEIEKFSPDVVAITSSTPMVCRTIEIVDFVKVNYHNIPVIIGGNHVTSIPQQSATEINADVIVVGEGEITFFELIQLLKNNGLTHNILKDVKGVCYKNDDRIIITEPRPFIEDLDTVPFPARDLFDMKYYLNSPSILGTKILKTTQMMTSRGCPYSCVFCTCSTVHKHRPRFFSPEYVIKEIEYLIDKYKIEGIKFVDDSFTTNKPRAAKICEMIIKRRINEKVAFNIQARADQIHESDRGFLKLLKEANFVEICYGFESGSPRILKFLKGNTTTVEDNSRVIRLTNEVGICILGYFMVGTIGETYEDARMTVDFIKKHKKMITNFGLAITTAYPGTKLWDICKEKGLLKDIKWNDYIIDNFATLKKPLCFSDVFTSEELVSIHRKILAMMVKSYPWKIRLKKIMRDPIKIITVGIPYLKHRVGIGENDM
jgi:radical SAM superfamily enzyme YgiQ (UPF0313 family)